MGKNKFLILTLIYFCIFSGMYCVLVPPFETPDEQLHLDYINYISRYGELPDQYEGQYNDSLYVGQGHQHPLYYLFWGGIVNVIEADDRIDYPRNEFTRNWHGGTPENNRFKDSFAEPGDKLLFYLIRSISILLSCVTIIFTYRIARLFTDDERFINLSVFFAASLPQFQFISATVNNDPLAIAVTTICIFFLLSINKYPEKAGNYILLGVFLAAGILIKKTLFFLLPAVPLVLLYTYYKNKPKGFFRYSSVLLALIVVGLALIALRNYPVYGEFFGSRMEVETMPQFVEHKSIISMYFIKPFLTGMFSSFVGVFGWMNIPLPKFITLYYLLFLGAGFTMSVISLLREKLKDSLLLIGLVLILLCFGGVVYFNLTFTQYQGRYMFPVLSLISVIAAYGVSRVSPLNKLLSGKRMYIVYAGFIISDIIGVYTIYNFY